MKLLEHDKWSGITTYFDYDPLTDTTTLKHVGDVTNQIEASKTLQNDAEYTKKQLKQDQLHYAHIPDAILLQWHGMGVNIKDSQALFEMVNKPEWSYLKTTTLHHKAKS